MKKLITFLSVFIFFNSSEIKCQGLSNLWLFGYDSYTSPGFGGTDINFFTGVANITSHQRPMNLDEADAAITDKQGNLLFYTNGCYIANSLDLIMDNGDSLIYGPFANDYCEYGSPLTQGALILPFPNNDSLYYLFYENIFPWGPTNLNPTELLFSIIDMSQDSGLGKVIQKGNSIVNDTLLWGELTAVKHANGRDWWVLCHKWKSKQFINFLITPNGISAVNTQIIGKKLSSMRAQICFSPDGSKMARYERNEDLDIFDFDRCTGILSNFVHIAINDNAGTTGVSFSNNSQFLYAFSYDYVYQFDITSGNINNTKITVATYDGFVSPFPTQFYECQLAQDGKIYGCPPNGVNVMHVINYPDSAGNSCNLIQHGVSLPTYNSSSLPTPPNYFLGPVVGSLCDSLPHVGIIEINNHDFHFSISPNPITDGYMKIMYLLPQNKPGWFEVYDVNGRKVYKMPLPPWSTLQQIKLPELSNGIYNAVITSGGYRVGKKMAVME